MRAPPSCSSSSSSGVELVLEDALRGEVFAREGDGLFGPGVVHVVELAEGVLERRPDEGAECAQVGHFDAEVAQGVLHRAGDAQHGVGQRAVEVEEDVSPVHGSLVCSLLCGAKIGIRLRFSKPAEFFRQTGFPPSLFPAVGLPAVPFPSGGLPPQAGRRRFLRQRTLPEGVGGGVSSAIQPSLSFFSCSPPEKEWGSIGPYGAMLPPFVVCAGAEPPAVQPVRAHRTLRSPAQCFSRRNE